MMNIMKDQLEHWNHAHSEQWLHKHSSEETVFAKETASQLAPKSTILELGCGEGNDSIYFAKLGHTIVATDFSDVAIKQNKKRWIDPNLTFRVQDISHPLQFDDASFDVVYARLSLHYFTDKITREAFKEISRVLKPGGTLYFMCKSTADHIYGQGDKIEADMYELNGHVRHFFSKEYVSSLLDATSLKMKQLEMGEEQIYDRQSGFIKVTAMKPLGDSEISNRLDEGPFYHGTKADLQIGDLLTPGFKSNYRPEVTMNHIYFTALSNGAGLAAELASGNDRPRVYIVEPVGDFENDPNVTDKKYPGNPTRSYRSESPLRIVGEVEDWKRLTSEELQGWRERLQNIKGDIIN